MLKKGLYMFSDKVNLIFNKLGATSTDIARFARCNSSNISRLRAGTRVPKSTSPTVTKLIDGIYLFADSMNTLPVLCSLIGCEVTYNKETLKNKICNWLYQTSENDSTIFTRRDIDKETKLFIYFGEKLNAIMNMLELSNVRLGKIINVDPSHISRFRNGVRTPRSNMLLINLICDELLLRIVEQNKINELAKLMNVNPLNLVDNEIRSELFRNWLCDFDLNNHIDSLDILLDSIDSFSLNNNVLLPEIDSFLDSSIIDANKTTYWHYTGLQEAVLRFLGDVIINKVSEIWLYSDQNMNWLINDDNYRLKWLALMTACVKNKTKIKIIHNIDRVTEEMLSGIINWMPLYMSGLIEPYVCQKNNDARFSHTIFLSPGKASIYASLIRDNEDLGWYEYFDSPDKLEAIKAEYNCLISLSKPLLKTYVNRERFMIYENNLKVNNSDLHVMLSSLSLGTMPPKLLDEILKRNKISSSEQQVIKTYYNNWHYKAQETLKNNNVWEYIPIPNDEKLFNGLVKIGLGSLALSKEIYYTPEEFSKHIDAIITLINENTNYHLLILPELPFSDLQIIRQNNYVIIIKENTPYVAFVFTHPYMIKTFDEYFDSLYKKHFSNRTSIKQQLIKYL